MGVSGWLIHMRWTSKRRRLDPYEALAIDFAVAQDGNFYVSGEAGMGNPVVLVPVRMMVYL